MTGDSSGPAGALPRTLAQIAALLEATLLGDGETAITGLAGVEEAEPGDLVFAETARFLDAALASPAAAILTTAETARAFPKPAR
ncbi:MAG TPA: LpxD N-terminal domain-containing protein, partial [Chthonomonadaceae bacterium]|nr:LpxD N-terminal domain-containing protein [Chthonomonadaceae bacterium]